AFALLSTANEGVSQASLQAAYLGLPLITTRVGGLPEVCVDDMTGYTVDRLNPEQVARAVTALMEHSPLRERLGRHAKELVEDRYLWKGTLDGVESMYAALR
ncbi:MAG: glycosyltransferase family 4 protein, partial [Chlamydiia bacterium]|nr:glycosyltransferase family 4 protein [Chlamydiia bacterium]